MTKKQIDELTQRMDKFEERLERLEPKEPPTINLTRISYKHASEDEPPLQPLTAEETAFLKERGIDPDQRHIPLTVQMKAMKDNDPTFRLIKQIRKKRAVQVNYYQ